MTLTNAASYTYMHTYTSRKIDSISAPTQIRNMHIRADWVITPALAYNYVYTRYIHIYAHTRAGVTKCIWTITREQYPDGAAMRYDDIVHTNWTWDHFVYIYTSHTCLCSTKNSIPLLYMDMNEQDDLSDTRYAYKRHLWQISIHIYAYTKCQICIPRTPRGPYMETYVYPI